MGVPKLFRFFTEQIDDLTTLIKENESTPDFDNLYLDMNGIIHNCSHADGTINISQPEAEVFQKICDYVEKLYDMIQPKQLLFLGVDGVAPRAKMNQQRSRRFRVANESYEREKKARKKNEELPEGDRFDSNCITPGTVFMERLNVELNGWIGKRKRAGLWGNCRVILSGPGVPGEGEHKIMECIRNMQKESNYNPNTSHCMYGLDADLIMLGLCTHERNFTLLREEVIYDKKQTKDSKIENVNFVLVNLEKIKKYLDKEFSKVEESDLKFEYNINRIIDDWIFMVVLVGNDFIPNLPNIQINKDAFPVIHETYRTILPQLEGYITENGNLNLDRLERFVETLAPKELDLYFTKVGKNKKHRNFRNEKKRSEKREHKKLQKLANGENTEIIVDGIESTISSEKLSSESETSLRGSTELKLPTEPIQSSDIPQTNKPPVLKVKKERPPLSPEKRMELFANKKIKYYKDKLKFSGENQTEQIKNLVKEYVKAIQWILNYYYKGVSSWGWYYPYHYAPYIADIKNIKDIQFDFQLGEPFKPFQQLLAVLPPASKSLLPECYHNLMTDDLLKDYYPTQIKTDNNGKKKWEALVILNFIDEVVLLEAMQPLDNLLNDEEINRNTHSTMLTYS